MRPHSRADGQTRIPVGAGPGAGDPNLVTSSRHDRQASRPTTRCSSTAGTSDSKTSVVRGMRSPGTARRVRSSSGCRELSRSDQSSSAPSSSGTCATAHSAPLPQAVDRIAPPGSTARCRVAGPAGVNEVRQIPLPSIRRVGSWPPRRNGISVRCGFTGCPGVQVLLTGPTVASHWSTSVTGPLCHPVQPEGRQGRAGTTGQQGHRRRSEILSGTMLGSTKMLAS